MSNFFTDAHNHHPINHNKLINIPPVPPGDDCTVHSDAIAVPRLSRPPAMPPLLSPVPLRRPAVSWAAALPPFSPSSPFPRFLRFLRSLRSLRSLRFPPLRARITREGRCPSREASALMRAVPLWLAVAATLRQEIFDSSLAGALRNPMPLYFIDLFRVKEK